MSKHFNSDYDTDPYYKKESNMSLLEKVKKNSTIKDTAILAKSKFFAEKDMIPR